ncbi:hypothetical protein IL992_15245 [Microbispora sp. NEAU-D428]|uniref:hypothetical protein n=1 Tax=Microbispora sitophila TaxID=2771537 RepID=UPI0018672961|nr:hypothetical protein [Microbispora sitophila]MBE3010540.1 hypothetical protein [Microbispora sitophila]
MRDPATEDAYEQDDSFIRPYIAGEGQYGGEGDRFWSEEQDDRALGGRPGDQGDVLSEGWRPDQPAQTPADHADQDDYAAGRTARLRPEDLASDEETGDLVSDGDTDPRGFLGSGWRSAPDADEDEDEGSRRGGMLLRTGLIAVGVLGAIWALALWVGQPSGAECDGGAGCAAGAGTAATAPVSPAPTDAAPTEAAPTGTAPSDAPSDTSSDAPRAEPTRTRPGASGTSAPDPSSAPTHTPRSRGQDPGSRTPASTHPSRSRLSIDTQGQSPADEHTDEQAEGTASGTDTASEEQAATAPTAAPAPTQEAPHHGGGLFGWLF